MVGKERTETVVVVVEIDVHLGTDCSFGIDWEIGCVGAHYSGNSFVVLGMRRAGSLHRMLPRQYIRLWLHYTLLDHSVHRTKMLTMLIQQGLHFVDLQLEII